ncbi:Inner membrane protein YgaZ [Sulfurospirillum diekertiae]|uniref:Inner membrane protein YgaZ n=2 Tax=Sulfurospirillum diekertiae TaxID=1854492 RepID=A0A1Y0HP86_9BACT|nr:AzlC family ABC transporter permease [Sulfurospirillum diekertiae]ARU49184.1 Inner membrane protein YgaZ [Sulfurospirillum diekertiae]
MNFLAIFKLTVPVMMGYIPLGMAFGLLLSKLLIPWYYAFFMSVFIFAGSGQFLALTLFASQATILEIGIATFLLNLRHTFYGLSMISTFKAFSWKKHYLIFGLTDETFALLKTSEVPEENRERAYLWITFLNQCYWIIGSVVGAVLGNILPFNYKGIEFSLTALFVVLSIELYKKNRLHKPFFVALIIGLFGMILFPPQKMLILSLCAAAFVLIVFKRSMENGK